MLLPNSVPLSFLAFAKVPKLHTFSAKNVLAHLLILYLSKEHYESLTNKYAKLMMLGKTLLCYFFSIFMNFILSTLYRIYPAIRHVFFSPRMTSNFNLMKFCYNTKFTLPKQSQRSRSVL